MIVAHVRRNACAASGSYVNSSVLTASPRKAPPIFSTVGVEKSTEPRESFSLRLVSIEQDGFRPAQFFTPDDLGTSDDEPQYGG
jgi:hypothetical protein